MTCNVCRKTLPRTEEHFYFRTRTGKRVLAAHICKNCSTALRRENRAKERARRPERPARYSRALGQRPDVLRACTRCLGVFPETNEYWRFRMSGPKAGKLNGNVCAACINRKKRARNLARSILSGNSLVFRFSEEGT